MSSCLYCGRELEDRPRSREHIVPACIGGAGSLVTRLVCDPCNELMSGTVDIAFCRDWFISSSRLTVGVENRGKPPVHLMGRLDWDREEDALNFVTREGITIFRISNTPDGRPRIVIGIDDGDQTLVDAARRVLAERFAGIPVINGPGEWTDYELGLAQSVIDAGPAYSLTAEIDVTAWDRQIVKMALGLSAVILGEPYIRSESAEQLRSFVFEPSADVRAQMKLRGSTGIGELTSPPQATAALHPGGDEHLFVLMRSGPDVAFVANLFGQYENIVRVAEAGPYSDSLPGELLVGVAWVVDAVAKTVRGPVPVETLVLEASEDTA